MKILFNPETTKDMLERYYFNKEDFDCEVSFKMGEVPGLPMGRCMVRTGGYYTVSAVLTGNVFVDEVPREVTSTLRSGELIDVFQNILVEEGYTVEGLETVIEDNKFIGMQAKMSVKKKVKGQE